MFTCPKLLLQLKRDALRPLKQPYRLEDVGGKQIIPATCVHWGITPSKTPLPSFLPSLLLNLQTAQAPLVR